MYLIYDPLHQIKLALQRRVQKQRQRVKLHPEAVTRPLRARLLQVCPLHLSLDQKQEHENERMRNQLGNILSFNFLTLV